MKVSKNTERELLNLSVVGVLNKKSLEESEKSVYVDNNASFAFTPLHLHTQLCLTVEMSLPEEGFSYTLNVLQNNTKIKSIHP